MQLRFLRPLYEEPGPFASVYLDTSRGAEDAANVVALRWRALREELSRNGADTGTLDAAGEVVTDPAMAAPGRAVFARAGSVAFTASVPDPPRREIARWAPLPDLMPLLAQYPPRAPHLLVSASRAGGEVIAVRTADDVLRARVDGHGWPVHKTKVGGWAQKRFQRSAEEDWDENAKELAAVVAGAAAQVEAEAVIVAGDVKACSLLTEKLPASLRERSVVVGREVGADSGAMAEAADEAIGAAADLDRRQRLGSFRNQLGSGRAVEGLAETVAALAGGQVSDLFLAGDPVSGDAAWAAALAWIGPELADIGLSEADLAARGVSETARDNAGAAIIRAAAGTDAALHFVPDGEQPPRDGIGALLRYAVPGA
jgi:hypothetical protein